MYRLTNRRRAGRITWVSTMSAPRNSAPTVPYTDIDRDKWIAEAAYYRAEKRGFAPGYALEDWLAAEAMVDFELKQASSR